MPGTVHVVAFSNFEGWPLPKTAQAGVDWFEACSRVHPRVKWTHLYNPSYLTVRRPEMEASEVVFSPYLLELQRAGRAEVGLHIHVFFEMVRAMGLEPRHFPFAGDRSPNCDTERDAEKDARQQGYDVMLTGYSAAERAALLDRSIEAFEGRGFGRLQTYCAAYGAIDSALCALLNERGFTTDMSVQAPPPDDAETCWGRPLFGHVSPLTLPYRLNRHSILPPPHESADYLSVVELPLNMGVDDFPIYHNGQAVSREAMFDLHCNWAREHEAETMVAIGVHTDIIVNETWPHGGASGVIDRFFSHVERRVREGDVTIDYGTASEVAPRFRDNTSLGAVSVHK